MALNEALVSQCPHCRSGDRLVRAAEAHQESNESADGADMALPAYEYWSLLLVGAIVLAMLSAMAQSLTPTRYVMAATVAVMMAAGVFGLIGLWQTSRNVARMRAVEPSVRGYHENALYCENCEHMHFPAGVLPPGFKPHEAWTFFEYRRELWYSCGFIKCGFFSPRA